MAEWSMKRVETVEELMAGLEVPAALQEGVLQFLRAHKMESPDRLAATAPEDLSDAFALQPSSFKLGHRASVRRIREAAIRQRLPPGGTTVWGSLCALARPEVWLEPSALELVNAVCELRAKMPGLFVPLWAIALSGVLGLLLEAHDVWSFLTEWDTRCEHPTLPGGNDTGIQFLVLSMSPKTSRMLSEALHKIGVRPSYQGVDLSMLFWSGLYDDFHRNSGSGPDQKAQHVLLRAYPRLMPATPPDIQVLNHLSREALASSLSRCRPLATSLTGVENLFWPIYEASPNAKVILGPFVPGEKIFDFRVDFRNPNFIWSKPLFMLWDSAPHMLPWTALLHLLDPLLGHPLRQRLAAGQPLTQAWDPLTAFWFQGLTLRRGQAHRTGGLRYQTDSEVDSFVFHEHVQQMIPPERLFNWDSQTHGWKELCDLAGVSPCPWKGPLRDMKPLPDFKFDDVATFWLLTVVHLILIWCNAQVVRCLVGPPARQLGKLLGRRVEWLYSVLRVLGALGFLMFVFDAWGQIAEVSRTEFPFK